MDFVSVPTQNFKSNTPYHSLPKQQIQVVAPYKLPPEYHREEKTFLISRWCKGPFDGKKTSEKHAAEDKDHALLYMHLNNLEINMFVVTKRQA